MSNNAKPGLVSANESFEFSAENRGLVDKVIAMYPVGRQASAVMPLLYLAQRQAGGWLPRAAMDHVAAVLGMAPIRVYEVATFYTMYNKEPVGKFLIQVCRTTPCWLRGSDELTRAAANACGGLEIGETSVDGLFTLVEVECLGACANAPMVQINDDYYEDLDPGLLSNLIEALRSGAPVSTGSQTGRKCSEPKGGATTLNNISGLSVST